MSRIHRRTVVKSIAAAGAYAAGGALLGASFDRAARAEGARVVTFGGTIPFSGRWAEVGQSVNAGYQTVAKFINEELGGLEVGGAKYRLEVKLVDDASDPQRATTLIQRQIDEGTRYFLGSYSSPMILPTAAITERAQRPMVQAGGGADAIFTQGYRYVFGMYPRASRSAFPAVEAFKTLTPRPKTVAVAYTNDPFSKPQGEGVTKRLKDEGFEVVDSFVLPPQLSDVSSMLASVKQKQPDILACLTTDQNSLLIAKQMVQSGTNVKLLFTSLGPQAPSFRESLGKYADGLTCISTWDPSFPYHDKYFGTTQRFAEYYRKHNTLPLIYHQGTAAACIIAYAQVLQQVGRVDRPQAVRDALAKLDIESIYGRIKFTPQGDGDPVLMGSAVTQVQGGNVKVIYPAKLKTAEPIYPMVAWDKR